MKATARCPVCGAKWEDDWCRVHAGSLGPDDAMPDLPITNIVKDYHPDTERIIEPGYLEPYPKEDSDD